LLGKHQTVSEPVHTRIGFRVAAPHVGIPERQTETWRGGSPGHCMMRKGGAPFDGRLRPSGLTEFIARRVETSLRGIVLPLHRASDTVPVIGGGRSRKTQMGHSGEPFFSVVIPTFERPKELAACLQSLTALDYDRASFEVLVVDDGSGTPLEAVVARVEDSLDVTLLRQKNAGPAAARNTGASRAKGDYLVFIDDDCAPAADYLSRMAARLAIAPDCMIGGRTVNALGDNVYSTAHQTLTDYLYNYYNADPHHGRFLTSNNMVVPTHVFRAMNGFDTGFMLAAFEDREICERFVRSGRRIIYASEAIVYHSHRMTFRRYWRQHFTYGRGASVYHNKLREHTAGGTHEPARFYINLVRHPLSRRADSKAVAIAGLMVASQAATALGYLRERLSRRLRASRVQGQPDGRGRLSGPRDRTH
jgi:GT2 family glycosyltransferase